MSLLEAGLERVFSGGFSFDRWQVGPFSKACSICPVAKKEGGCPVTRPFELAFIADEIRNGGPIEVEGEQSIGVETQTFPNDVTIRKAVINLDGAVLSFDLYHPALTIYISCKRGHIRRWAHYRMLGRVTNDPNVGILPSSNETTDSGV